MQTIIDVLMNESQEKRATNIAKNLIELGNMTAEQIAKVTGLTIDDILKLQSER